MFGFLLGAVVGGIASYYWRENIRHYMSKGVPDLRKRAADGLGTLGDRASGALDQARSRIDTAVRTGQERLRPTGTAGSEQNREWNIGTIASGTIVRHWLLGVDRLDTTAREVLVDLIGSVRTLAAQVLTLHLQVGAMRALLSRKGTLSESEVAAAFAELEASTAVDAFLNQAAPDVNEVFDDLLRRLGRAA
jgi:hypothetical protein